MRWAHVTIKADGGATWASDGPTRRRLRQRVLAVLEGRVAVHAWADNHAHLLVTAGEEGWRAIAGVVVRLVQELTGVTLERAHVQPLQDRAHEDNAVRYVLRQGARHGLGGHPAVSPDHGFAALVGARRTGLAPAVFWGWRRRWTRDDLFGVLGLTDPGVASDEVVAGLGLAELDRLALDAFDVDAEGTSALRTSARRVVCGLARGVRQADLAVAVGLSRQRVSQLVAEGAPDADLELVRRRVALERAVAEQLRRLGQEALAEQLREVGGRRLPRRAPGGRGVR